MNVVLVFPPFYHPAMYNLPPLGLINLATALRDQCHQASIVDLILAMRTGELAAGPAIYDDSARLILEREPELVAFSAQCATYPPVIQIARRLRQLRPKLQIVIGGHNASFAAEQTIDSFDAIDAVVRGEGEQTFPELMNSCADGGRGETVAGVTFRRGCEIITNPDRELIADLDSLPLPDYRLAPSLEEYRLACDLPRRIAILEVGRGCPHRCVYCSESALWRRQTRTYSIDRLLCEMENLRDRHGAERFLLAYDQFTADRSFVEKFCHRVIDAGLNRLPWYCISRLDSVDGSLLELMQEAGCESMCYGIDSGSEKTLAFIRKRIDRSILLQRVQETTDRLMVPTLSFIIGFPEEKRTDVDATLTLALRTGIQGNSNPLIQLPTVLPGTELHRRYGKTLERGVDTYFALGLEFDEGKRLAEDERLIDRYPLLFSSFYNLPGCELPLTELDLLANGFPLVAQLYPRSFLLLCYALEQSPSHLFASLLDFVAEPHGRKGASLTAADCYRHFAAFVQEQTAELAEWPHLPDLIAYETRALEAGKLVNNDIPANIDLNRIGDWRPLMPSGVLLAQFRHNLPTIFNDIKKGTVRKGYRQEPVWMIFRQQGDRLEVTEVNDFGHDLLRLCDGTASIGDIAARLHHRYGNQREQSDFETACRQAAEELYSMEFVMPAGQTQPGEEVIEC